MVESPVPEMPPSAIRRAKLRAPAPSPQYLRRARLMELLDAVVGGQITLVTAGAGTGKTTLVSGWVAEASMPTAWVSLDNTDRGVRSFWASVVAALRTLVPECGAQATTLLRQGASISHAVGELLDDLDRRECPRSVLVVDDLHIVDDVEDIMRSLDLFVRHLPDWLRLVALSRRDVALPRDRLRAQGRLGEVQFAELRFLPTESRELLQLLAPTMSASGIEAVATRADGWAAGLRLAALAARAASAQGSAESAGIGDARLVHDFVLHDVLAAEAPDLVEFLFAISVAVRVNPSLAEALTGRPDAHDYLSRAEARGLFVNRLGADGWFQVHSLARTALTAELGSRSPARLAELQVRAARWYEEMGETPLALEHLLLAGRSRDALRLLATEAANLYDRGQEATVNRVIAAIVPEVATTDLESMIEFAWCHLLIDRRQFTELVEQLDWWVQRSEEPVAVIGRVMILRSMESAMNGRWVEAGTVARAALREFGDAAWRDPFGRFGWNMAAREIALCERWDDSSDEVREVRLALGRDPKRRLAYEGTRALGEALAGRPVDALRITAGVRHAASVSEMTILRGELTLAEAIAHREVGERARAFDELQLLAAGSSEIMLFCKVRAALELTRAHLDVGELDAANELFADTQVLIERESFGANGRDWLSEVGTVLALANGDAALAARFAGAIDDSFWAAISAARLSVFEGDRANAAATLESAVPRCPRQEVVLGLLTARAQSHQDDAVKAAAIAVECAAAAGLVQTVASEGPEVVELVERAAWQAPDAWLDRVRLVATAAPAHVDKLGLIEPLTERERDVLRFLPSRLTIREIADELFVSINTLKFHLKVIYRKLGVSSRAEAAVIARRMSHLSGSAP